MAKVKLEEILNKCSVEELQFALEENKLPSSGKKAELVSRLASSLPPKKIFNVMSNKQLQAVLVAYGLPKSGNSDELVKRIQSIIEAPKREAVRQAREPAGEAPAVTEKETAYGKGYKFEDQVAAWAKKKFKTDFARSDLARGSIAQRPHQVDVHVQIKHKGLFGGTTDDIWIECKTMKQTVKRTDISKLVNDAQDVFKAFKKGGEKLYYNGVMFVSTSKFDIDALNYANEYDVWCIYFDGKAYKEQNNPKNWLGEPAWFEQARYA